MGIFDLVRSLGGPKQVREVLDQTSSMLEIAEGLLKDSIAFRRGEKPDLTWEELDDRDQEINEIQQENRRKLIRHLSVNPQADVGTCLATMGLMKDIERIGDYSKNYLWVCREKTDGQLKDDLTAELLELENRVLIMLEDVHSVYRSEHEGDARELLNEEQALGSHTDEMLIRLLKGEAELPGESTKTAMLVHYLKRITGHLGNVASSVALPLPYQDKDEPMNHEEEA